MMFVVELIMGVNPSISRSMSNGVGFEKK